MMELIPLTHARLREIYRDVQESDGVITPDQEAEILTIMGEQAGVMGNAAFVASMEANAETLRMWASNARSRYLKWEEITGRIRAAMREPLKELLPDAATPKGTKSITSSDGFVRAGLRQNNKGRLELNDSQLEDIKQVRGYTEQQVQSSDIDRRFFEPQVVYKLKTDDLLMEVALAENLKPEERPKGLGLCTVDREPSVVIRLMGSSGGKDADRGSEKAMA